MRYLYIIPARGGSKGVPYKNIKLLNNKPLIYYTLDVARALSEEHDICVSTDDQKIVDVVEMYPQKVPFIRPDHLATDNAGTYDVLMHAIQHYESIGKTYDAIVLLQPTSPLRTVQQVSEALMLFHTELDMVVSVKKSHTAGVICSENENGYLEMTLNHSSFRRQDMKPFYEYNGAIYVINVQSLKQMRISNFKKVVKYVMDEESSIDIDTELDIKIAEFLLK